jgi:hypothetical protein
MPADEEKFSVADIFLNRLFANGNTVHGSQFTVHGSQFTVHG